MTIDKLITEQQLIKIVEERGVAASPWKREIDNIAMYIRQEIKTLLKTKPLGSELSFSIPQEYLKDFNFLKNPQININANYSKQNILFGSGVYRNGKVSFFTKRLKNAVINITCYYNDEGKVWLNSVLKTLYHELNHAYDAWLNGHKDKNFKRFYKSAKKGVVGNKLTENTQFPYIGICIYRLFSETEYNALVASVFGDLQGLESDLTTFQNDYKHTMAYQIYIDLKTNLQSEIESLTAENCRNLLLLLRKYQISINMKNNTMKSFKIAFLSKADKMLNQLLHDIGRVASFYYDIKNEENLENDLIEI